MLYFLIKVYTIQWSKVSLCQRATLVLFIPSVLSKFVNLKECNFQRVK